MSKKNVWLGMVIGCAALGLWLVITAGLSISAVQNFQLHNWQRARRSAFCAEVLLSPFRYTVGVISPDVRLWSNSLQILQTSSRLVELSSSYLPATFSQDNSAKNVVPELKQQLQHLDKQAQNWVRNYSRSLLFPKIINRNLPLQLRPLLQHPDQLESLVHQVVFVSNHFLTGKHRYAVLLQNNDELRATGGFMGSYLLFEIQEGVVSSLEIQDIYVPDGQYQGYTNPPAGVDEYLSGGKGFRLPDSNWNPDFPAAGQDILQFFALGKETDLEGLVAVNLNVAEDVLQVIGPVRLADYDQTVTADNLSLLARLDRSQFFPGSQQKSQFLNALFTQLKLNLKELSAEDLQTMLEILTKASKQKNLQAYSLQPELQKLLAEHQLTGQMLSKGSNRYFFLVESNVGINKANRLITRQVSLQFKEQQTLVKVEFQNKNPQTTIRSERGDYINYQRLYFPASYQAEKLYINGALVDRWDEQVITTSAGEQLKQIGFLVPVAAESSSQFILEVSHPAVPFDQVVIQKQSGLPPTPYQLTTPTHTFSFILEQDVDLPLNK